MNDWPMTQLAAITTKIGSGATPRGGKESYKEEGMTLIRSLNVYDFKFERDGLAFIDEAQALQLSNVEVQEHDILLNITGASVARCCMVPSTLLPARVNQHVAIVRINPKLANPSFVLYAINSPKYKHHLLSLAQGGATREALTKETIESFHVPFPPLLTQNKIASVLSAYDDLIENNTRRIQILEEMAQALYREWFVHFRFPEHEKSRMVESEMGPIPENWETRQIADVADVNAHTIRNGSAPDTIHYVDIASVSTGHIDEITLYTFSQAPGRARRIVTHGDIIWSCVRPNRKSYSLVLRPVQNMIVSTGFAVLTARVVPYTFLYQTVTTDAFVSFLVNRARGAAYPAVTGDDFAAARLVVPPTELLATFHQTAESMYMEADTLRLKNNNLTQTRNLLLPKLISGEVDVADLDIATGEAN